MRQRIDLARLYRRARSRAPGEGGRPAAAARSRAVPGDAGRVAERGLSTVIMLGDVAARTDRLEVSCPSCDRWGMLSTAKLLAEHGPDYAMPELLNALTADCPKREGRLNYCQARFPQLPTLFRA